MSECGKILNAAESRSEAGPAQHLVGLTIGASMAKKQHPHLPLHASVAAGILVQMDIGYMRCMPMANPNPLSVPFHLQEGPR